MLALTAPIGTLSTDYAQTIQKQDEELKSVLIVSRRGSALANR
jgi:hypothetical protein